MRTTTTRFHIIMRSAISVGLCIGALACASGGSDDRAGLDAGPRVDFGGRDAAPVDASEGTDLGDPADLGGADLAGADAGEADLGGGDAGGVDASMPDAFVPDMGTPDLGGCAVSADCDDGDACNGAETCASGSCVAGTPMDCSDAVACTVDGCAASACTHTPDDTLCAGSLTCDATMGCVDTSCMESPCRLVGPQCGCPSGQACSIAATGARSCQVEGVNGESARCETGGCTAGNVCVNISLTATDVAMCKRFCDSDADCTGGPGSVCLAELGMTGQDICTSSCEPAAQTGCPANSFCGIFTETATGRRLTDCSGPVGAGGQGASCTGTENCQKGFTCANPGTGNICMRWCRRSPAGGECSFGETCIGFDPALVFNSTEYGVCF